MNIILITVFVIGYLGSIWFWLRQTDHIKLHTIVFLLTVSLLWVPVAVSALVVLWAQRVPGLEE